MCHPGIHCALSIRWLGGWWLGGSAFAAICLLAWVLAFILNRLLFQEIIKRKDDLIADRDKKLAGLPIASDHGVDKQLLLTGAQQELALAQKETQEAVAALAGKRQQLKEVQRERDSFFIAHQVSR